MVSWNILSPFGIFLGHLVYFVGIWYSFPRFGMFYEEKSGNPEEERKNDCIDALIFIQNKNNLYTMHKTFKFKRCSGGLRRPCWKPRFLARKRVDRWQTKSSVLSGSHFFGGEKRKKFFVETS
jgi:hypothetical protein